MAPAYLPISYGTLRGMLKSRWTTQATLRNQGKRSWLQIIINIFNMIHMSFRMVSKLEDIYVLI